MHDFLNNNKIKVLSVTETWLTSDCSSSFVDLPGFEFFRGDVEGAVRKHGTGIYVSKEFNCVKVVLDMQNVVVVYLKDFDVYVVSIYRPPSYSGEQNQRLIDFIKNFSIGRELIIMGDFNLPTLRWPTQNISMGVSVVDREFLECFVVSGLTQWVKFGT